jgi:hypothetical protein
MWIIRGKQIRTFASGFVRVRIFHDPTHFSARLFVGGSTRTPKQCNAILARSGHAITICASTDWACHNGLVQDVLEVATTRVGCDVSAGDGESFACLTPGELRRTSASLLWNLVSA